MSWLAISDGLAEGMDDGDAESDGSTDIAAAVEDDGGELGESSTAGAQAARRPTRPRAMSGRAYLFMSAVRDSGHRTCPRLA
jgi:hypothetical protein